MTIVHWLPRALCMAAILFISLFAADSFAPNLTIWQQVGGFLLHLVPSFILASLLAVAWKWEKIGGIIFTIIGIVTSPMIYLFNYQRNHSVWISTSTVLSITFPFVVIGILFLVSHSIKKRQIRS
jgi:hypothetical protein